MVINDALIYDVYGKQGAVAIMLQKLIHFRMFTVPNSAIAAMSITTGTTVTAGTRCSK